MVFPVILSYFPSADPVSSPLILFPIPRSHSLFPGPISSSRWCSPVPVSGYLFLFRSPISYICPAFPFLLYLLFINIFPIISISIYGLCSHGLFLTPILCSLSICSDPVHISCSLFPVLIQCSCPRFLCLWVLLYTGRFVLTTPQRKVFSVVTSILSLIVFLLCCSLFTCYVTLFPHTKVGFSIINNNMK